MAFVKFRWPGQGASAEKPAKRSRSPQAESIEVMRRRARHRLMGAAVLVLLGVVGFPMLFDTQPRPIPVDVPIEIPDRNKAAPLVVPANAGDADAAKSVVASSDRSGQQSRTGTERLTASSTLADGEELVSSSSSGSNRVAVKPNPGSTAGAAVSAGTKAPETKSPPANAPKAVARAEDAATKQHLADVRKPTVPERSDDERFIVQVGAFADADKAKEVRVKLERAGLKTYTQVVDSKDGKRTRVRVGPYSSRAEADKAAARIKGLDLSASILTL